MSAASSGPRWKWETKRKLTLLLGHAICHLDLFTGGSSPENSLVYDPDPKEHPDPKERKLTSTTNGGGSARFFLGDSVEGVPAPQDDEVLHGNKPVSETTLLLYSRHVC